MAANDPLILKRNAGDTGFEEVLGASAARDALGAVSGVFPGSLVAAATDTTAGVVPGIGGASLIAPTLTNVATVGQMRGAGRSRAFELFADFYGAGDSIGFTSDSSGAGSGISYVVADHAAGIVGLLAISTGTATNGRGLFANSSLSQGPRLDDGVTYYEAKVRIPVLSDDTDAFTVFCGGRATGTNADTGGNDANGFRYAHGTNGGRWLAVSRSGGNESNADTGVAPTANVFQILGILINATGTSAGYYIDGALVATITTNIQVIGRGRPQHGLLKSAGTNARTLELDYVFIRKEFTAAR